MKMTEMSERGREKGGGGRDGGERQTDTDREGGKRQRGSERGGMRWHEESKRKVEREEQMRGSRETEREKV